MSRILHVLPSLSQKYGGPVRAVLDLSFRAQEYGLTSEVLGFDAIDIPDNPFDTKLIHSLPLSFPRRYCYSRELRSWLRSNLTRFDGVVLHGLWLYPNWAVASECIQSGIPYACFPHGMLEPWAVYHQSLWRTFKKLLYWHLRERQVVKRAKCLYFTTKRERYLAEKTFKITGMEFILAPYGIDVIQERISTPQNPDVLQPLDRKVALFLARLHPKKNVAFLIEAWKEAAVPKPWHLLIAGAGHPEYVARLKKLISDLGVSEQVQLVGFVSGKDKLYLLQRASWFLLPSLQENFGIAVLEAISHGCPVAISDQVFIAESMHDLSEVLPLEHDAWVKFIRDRMVDEEWRSTIATLDWTLLTNKFGIQKVAREWAEVLTESLVVSKNTPYETNSL